MTQQYDLQDLSDNELEEALAALVRKHSSVTALVVAHIRAFDYRRLYAKRACSSTFVYCQQRLHMSESMAGKYIRVARLAREFPVILELLQAGDTHLSNLVLIATHLTEANHRELLAAVKHKSKRQVELLLAEWFPRPAVPAQIRKLPPPRARSTQAPKATVPPKTDTTAHAPDSFALAPKPSKVEPLAPARFKVEFTADQELYDNIEEAKALLGPRLPKGELSELFGRAVALLVEDLKKKKYAKISKPRPSKKEKGKRTRHIPNHVKREVAERDGGQCTFVDAEGNRCEERWGLEFHHEEVPFASGGEHTPDNIRQVCRTHNRYRAEQEFGREFMNEKLDKPRMKQRGAFPGECKTTKSEPEQSGVSERRVSYRAGAPTLVHRRSNKRRSKRWVSSESPGTPSPIGPRSAADAAWVSATPSPARATNQ